MDHPEPREPGVAVVPQGQSTYRDASYDRPSWDRCGPTSSRAESSARSAGLLQRKMATDAETEAAKKNCQNNALFQSFILAEEGKGLQ